ncbi:protein of unknown function (DUF3352) [Rubidibacter lacunae KORDI 51-2]|uniref:DUF3352 domain-containing protein n=1 Tax=Rubidibacter lacunae KORDI 51-2 TaxID=582515 RepID=U5DK79_9CHRO|nr:DUF3352 domain-containing protein [Rubidibacter lacunae]ERN40984.1 protein of unknown function (DUF3352) [Rubidibacter lacunae KORDI 51-2]
MKLRSFLLVLAAGALSLVAIAAAGVFWILSDSPLDLRDGGVEAHPEAAVFVPRQAPLMGSLLVDVDRLVAYRQLLAPVLQRSRSYRELERLKADLLDGTRLNYARDIQPWLGRELTFAVTSLDYDRDPDNGVQPGYLLVATTDNGDRAREFLQAYYSRQAAAGTTDLVFEQYKGTNIIYRRPVPGYQGSDALASAVVGDRFVLFANHPKVLREALTDVQVPALNLLGSKPYQHALPTLTTPRIGEVFANVPAIAAWLAGKPALAPPESEQTLTVALSVNPFGVSAQTALQGIGTPGDRAPALHEPVGALRYVPAGSTLAIAGSDLAQLWADLDADFAPASPVAQLLGQWRDRLQDGVGLDVPEAIFSWVHGEYALALLPGSTSDSQGDWIFVAEKVPTDDPEATAAAAIARIDRAAADGGLGIGTFSLDGRAVTAWTQLQAAAPVDLHTQAGLQLDARVKGVRITVGNYVVLASSLAAIAQVSHDEADSLLARATFQDAIQSLPDDNDGYLYLDWRGSRANLEQQLPLLRAIELAGQPLFDHLGAVALSSRGSQDDVRQATVSLRLVGTE